MSIGALYIVELALGSLLWRLVGVEPLQAAAGSGQVCSEALPHPSLRLPKVCLNNATRSHIVTIINSSLASQAYARKNRLRAASSNLV
jgi:hypothetical protein